MIRNWGSPSQELQIPGWLPTKPGALAASLEAQGPSETWFTGAQDERVPKAPCKHPQVVVRQRPKGGGCWGEGGGGLQQSCHPRLKTNKSTRPFWSNSELCMRKPVSKRERLCITRGLLANQPAKNILIPLSKSDRGAQGPASSISRSLSPQSFQLIW